MAGGQADRPGPGQHTCRTVRAQRRGDRKRHRQRDSSSTAGARSQRRRAGTGVAKLRHNAACMPPNLPLMPPKHFRCLILLDWHKVIGRPQSDPVLQSFRNGAGSLQLGLRKPQAAAPADRWSETGATGRSYRERPFLRDPIANPMKCTTLSLSTTPQPDPPACPSPRSYRAPLGFR